MTTNRKNRKDKSVNFCSNWERAAAKCCLRAAKTWKNNVLCEIIHEGLNVVLFALCSFVLSEAREAFIKQFSLLEASTGTLRAQLHGITATLNCSISTAEAEGKERRKDDVCQTFEDTATMIRASQQQLKQATLDLDSMVHKWNTPKSSNFCAGIPAMVRWPWKLKRHSKTQTQEDMCCISGDTYLK